MTPEQVKLVKSSWEQIKPITAAAAELFYGKLFELDPSLRPMFKGDMGEQGRKLMTTITFAVSVLDNPETLVPAVESLGRRHMNYGVVDKHYDVVGAALIWTLQKGLGDAFNSELKTAWTETYMMLATTMKKAAARAA